MSRHSLTVTAVLIVIAAITPAFSNSRSNDRVSGEIIIKYKKDVPRTLSPTDTGVPSINKLNQRIRARGLRRFYRQRDTKHGMQAKKKFNFERTHVVALPADADLDAEIAEIKKDPDVEYVEPNRIYTVNMTPNDPDYSKQYALAKINAPLAWDTSSGASSVIIAIIDTGVDYTHPDLAANMWTNTAEIPGNGIDDDGNGYRDDARGWNFTNSQADPKDDHGHGTHCAGIAAAKGNNGVGIAGVSWGCKIMAVKGLSATGSGSTDQLASAIIYAVDNGAKVISNSWGGGSSFALEDAINYATEQGAIVVFSAGNSNTEQPSYPAFYDNAIAVASTDQSDLKSSFSNYGSWVDIAAPGTSIYSTFPTYPTTMGFLNYGTISGTSMACPAVSGLAGLLMSRYPTYTNAQIRSMIFSGADQLDTANPSYVGKLGAGRINAFVSLAEGARFSIDGYVRNSSNVGILGATVTLSGAAFRATVTNAVGYYQFLNLPQQNYSVTPFKVGMDMAPTQRVFNPLNVNQANQNFTATTALAPSLSVVTPANNAVLVKTITASGSASDDKAVVKVEIRIDTGPWIPVNGLTSWTYVLDTTQYPAGDRTLSVRAVDSAGLITTITRAVKFQNSAASVYNTTFKTPACLNQGDFCDTYGLVQGRSVLPVGGGEPNYPNTLYGSCNDGGYGDYHVDESNDRIRIKTLDGTPLAPGKQVQIEATVWAWSTGTDSLDLYRADNAFYPEWTYLTTIKPTVRGAEVLKYIYTLPEGRLQVIRARFRADGQPAACEWGMFNDHDDLVFATGAPDTTPPTMAIQAPAPNAQFTGMITVSGTASDNYRLQFVEVQVNSDKWQKATGLNAWSLNLDTSLYPNGTHVINVRTTDSFGLTVSQSRTVTFENGPAAVYDTTRKAPACLDARRFCDTFALVAGRGTNPFGPETNQPNTINNSCADGTLNYSLNPRIERVRVTSLDGQPMGANKLVKVDITVAGLGSRYADIYSATNANSPVWTYMGSVESLNFINDSAVSTFTYRLPVGSLQAVRVNYRIGNLASAGFCTKGQEDDRDDLIFAVAPPGTVPPMAAITSPAANSTVSSVVLVKGTAADNNEVQKVEVRVDNGPYALAAGLTNWEYALDTSLYTSASHTITARVTDWDGNTVTVSRNLVFNNPAAVYNTDRKAPTCGTIGASCDTFQLVNGRGAAVSGAELNQPNTINNSCPDGSLPGTPGFRTSVDRIRVESIDGSLFAPGKQVRIRTTVNSNLSNLSLDLYTAANADSPLWTYLGSTINGQEGVKTLEHVFTLPSGKFQAIRANFRPTAIALSSCTIGSVDDHDDLVFKVATPPAVTITAPTSGQSIVGVINVQGTAAYDEGISKVEVQIDGGAFAPAIGTTAWTYSLNTETLADGPHAITVRATNVHGLTASATVNVTVANTAAVYSSVYKAPFCDFLRNACDSGNLVMGRGTMAQGVEPNLPNTLNNSCPDGVDGTFHQDESLDRVKITATNGFGVGNTITVNATIWASVGMWNSNGVDFYYATNTSSPVWIYMGTSSPTAAGLQTVTRSFALQNGAPIQVIRVIHRRSPGNNGSCTVGGYRDHDDLVFRVDGTFPVTPAVYSTLYKTPLCDAVTRSCDSGALLVGRGTMAQGVEPNQPNSLGGTCPDGAVGTYRQDESLDRLVLTAAQNFTADQTITVSATIWVHPSFVSGNGVDFYYTKDANAPSWIYMGTSSPTASGLQTLSRSFTLQNGSAMQAIRAIHRRNPGENGPCTAGGYRDHDDMVFRVIGTVPNTKASYSTLFKTPLCDFSQNSCDSGNLLMGRGTMAQGGEPNQPNTIANSCPDGVDGTFHVNESLDKIVMTAPEGFRTGKAITVEASVWAGADAWTTNNVDFYYASNANSPVWTLLGSVAPNGSGARVVSRSFTLTDGAFYQAIRVVHRRSGTNIGSCVLGGYRDHDDMVFRVENVTGSGPLTAAAGKLSESPQTWAVSASAAARPVDVFAFPNPSKSPTFHIDMGTGAEAVQLTVFDTTGNKVHEANLTSPTEYFWDAGGMASGIYYYIVSADHDGKKTLVKKSLVILK